MTNQDKVSKIITMHEKGYSSRQISEILYGRPTAKSSVNDILKRVRQSQHSQGPKILFYDVESAPILGSVWKLWDNNVGLNQIERDWHLLSYSAKWLHSDDVMYEDQSGVEDLEDDRDLLQGIWNLLDECDIAVGHNSKKFDSKKLNARFILNGMQPPSHYRQIDTLEIAKRHFAFTSNKLEYLTDNLCGNYKKKKHSKFPGFELWKECMAGNPEAWKEMEIYNKMDVLSLEELYHILAPWSNQIPNYNTYTLGNTCQCGSSNVVKNGFHYTNLGVYNRYKCEDCGKQTRGRTNLLSKEQRSHFTVNI